MSEHQITCPQVIRTICERDLILIFLFFDDDGMGGVLDLGLLKTNTYARVGYHFVA